MTLTSPTKRALMRQSSKGYTLLKDPIRIIRQLSGSLLTKYEGDNLMLEEFKKFALRGNVVDLAVAVIIGVAFGAIITSLVQDIFMPIIGAITGGLDFSNYYLPLADKVQNGLSYADAKKQGAVLGYGQFITVAINFLIIALILFAVIQGINRLKRKQEAELAAEPAVELPTDVKLLSEIRDILLAQ